METLSIKNFKKKIRLFSLLEILFITQTILVHAAPELLLDLYGHFSSKQLQCPKLYVLINYV